MRINRQEQQRAYESFTSSRDDARRPADKLKLAIERARRDAPEPSRLIGVMEFCSNISAMSEFARNALTLQRNLSRNAENYAVAHSVPGFPVPANDCFDSFKTLKHAFAILSKLNHKADFERNEDNWNELNDYYVAVSDLQRNLPQPHFYKRDFKRLEHIRDASFVDSAIRIGLTIDNICRFKSANYRELAAISSALAQSAGMDGAKEFLRLVDAEILHRDEQRIFDDMLPAYAQEQDEGPKYRFDYSTSDLTGAGDSAAKLPKGGVRYYDFLMTNTANYRSAERHHRAQVWKKEMRYNCELIADAFMNRLGIDLYAKHDETINISDINALTGVRVSKPVPFRNKMFLPEYALKRGSEVAQQFEFFLQNRVYSRDLNKISFAVATCGENIPYLEITETKKGEHINSLKHRHGEILQQISQVFRDVLKHQGIELLLRYTDLSLNNDSKSLNLHQNLAIDCRQRFRDYKTVSWHDWAQVGQIMTRAFGYSVCVTGKMRHRHAVAAYICKSFAGIGSKKREFPAGSGKLANTIQVSENVDRIITEGDTDISDILAAASDHDIRKDFPDWQKLLEMGDDELLWLYNGTDRMRMFTAYNGFAEQNQRLRETRCCIRAMHVSDSRKYVLRSVPKRVVKSNSDEWDADQRAEAGGDNILDSAFQDSVENRRELTEIATFDSALSRELRGAVDAEDFIAMMLNPDIKDEQKQGITTGKRITREIRYDENGNVILPPAPENDIIGMTLPKYGAFNISEPALIVRNFNDGRDGFLAEFGPQNLEKIHEYRARVREMAMDKIRAIPCALLHDDDHAALNRVYRAGCTDIAKADFVYTLMLLRDIKHRAVDMLATLPPGSPQQIDLIQFIIDIVYTFAVMAGAAGAEVDPCAWDYHGALVVINYKSDFSSPFIRECLSIWGGAAAVVAPAATAADALAFAARIFGTPYPPSVETHKSPPAPRRTAPVTPEPEPVALTEAVSGPRKPPEIAPIQPSPAPQTAPPGFVLLGFVRRGREMRKIVGLASLYPSHAPAAA